MNKELSSEYGQIRIHRKVVAQIAELAAKDVDGVTRVGLECYGLLGTLLRILKRSGTKVITSNMKEVRVIIPVVTRYESNAVDLAYDIQKKVTAKLLSTLNMDSVTVDVKLKKIERGTK